MSDGDHRLDSIILSDGVLYGYGTHNPTYGIDLYTSSDLGLTWTGHGQVLDNTEAGVSDWVGQARVIVVGGTVTMFYSYRNGGSVLQGIRAAQSSSLLGPFTKVGGSDIIHVGSGGEADSTYIEWGAVRAIPGGYLQSYEGFDGTRWRACFASSANLLTGWTKSRTHIGPYGSVAWEQYHLATPAWYPINGKEYMFYQGAGDHLTPYISNPWDLGMLELDPSANFGQL
jgi:hypothetical protein